MDAVLSAARACEFAASVSLCGVFAFSCLVAGPALRQSGGDPGAAARLRRQLVALAWASLALGLVAGAVWLAIEGMHMSGQPLGAVLTRGTLGIVLTRTRFGEVWILRFALAAMLALCLIAGRRRDPRFSSAADAIALPLSVVFLAALAWVGHSGATPGPAGRVHLAADVLHLLAAGLWLGMLVPLALLLTQVLRAGGSEWSVARIATARFSLLAAPAVAVLFAAGLVNTWFLAGTIPALIGTPYGRLLLLKIAVFIGMLGVAAVNRLRLTPRLAGAAREAAGQLRRNAVFEGIGGIAVLGIVGVLGILPPGLHSEPVWPLPFRLDMGALGWPVRAFLAALALVAVLAAAFAVAAAAAGCYRRAAAALAGVVPTLALGVFVLRPAIAPAHPTTFFASAVPYAAPSVVRGAAIYAADCAPCHGAQGRGDGPAAAALPVRPADLTAPHLFAHPVGDLFWWVGHGAGHGAMPGFAATLDADRRWDVVNFIRARAAGRLAQKIGPDPALRRAYPVPDFAFEKNGRQQTLSRLLARGPVLLVLFGGPAPKALLTRLSAAGLATIAVDLDPGTTAVSEPSAPPELVAVADEVRRVLALFAPATGVSELLLDRAGDVRARWAATDGGLADIAVIAADARRVARLAAAPPSHAGHVH
ncbi:MAG TPA: copper homeostasis membrane protein CopD [Stellaceae bacterium]